MEPTAQRHSRAQMRRDARGAGHVYVLTADEGSLAELSAALQTVPYCARGRVFVEVPSEADVQALDVPTRMTVTWLPRSSRTGAPGTGEPCGRGLALRRAVCAWADEMLYQTPDVPHVWLGGDYRGVADVREHLIENLGVPHEQIATPEHYRLGS